TDIQQPIGEIMTLSSTYNSIKKATDSITDRELSFHNNYTTSYSLPAWFIDYERAEIIYAGAAYKIKRPEYNDRKKIFSDSLPDDYFDFLSKVQIDNQEAIFSTHYMTFLDYFFTQDLSMDKIREMSNFEGGIAFHSHILDRSKNELSEHAKEVYQKRNFTKMVMFYTNLKEIDSLAIEYELSEYENLLDVSGTRLKERIHPSNIQRGDIMPDFQLINQLEDTVSFRNFNQQIVYIKFWATWCRPCIETVPELNKLIHEHESDKRISFINICLDSEKNKWLNILKKYGVKGTNLYADENWSRTLRTNFNINGIPHYALIGKNNALIENKTSVAPAVKNKIEKIFSDKKPIVK
ncbi:MAG: TlpA family protein disulfide reductase, partial [Cyclobacteriaceae bacterium]|nr:TlpA family protein disulfide reductase [Cyclobacteriaceae bacterium]